MFTEQEIRSVVRKHIKEQSHVLVGDNEKTEELTEGFFGDIRDKFIGYFRKNNKPPEIDFYSVDRKMSSYVAFVKAPDGLYEVVVEKSKLISSVKTNRSSMKKRIEELKDQGRTHYTREQVIRNQAASAALVGGVVGTVTSVSYVGIMMLIAMYGGSAPVDLDVSSMVDNSDIKFEPTNQSGPSGATGSYDMTTGKVATWEDLIDLKNKVEAGEITMVDQKTGQPISFEQFLADNNMSTQHISVMELVMNADRNIDPNATYKGLKLR